MNAATASFNTTVRQMTEMSQRKKKPRPKPGEKSRANKKLKVQS